MISKPFCLKHSLLLPTKYKYLCIANESTLCNAYTRISTAHKYCARCSKLCGVQYNCTKIMHPSYFCVFWILSIQISDWLQHAWSVWILNKLYTSLVHFKVLVVSNECQRQHQTSLNLHLSHNPRLPHNQPHNLQAASVSSSSSVLWILLQRR